MITNNYLSQAGINNNSPCSLITTPYYEGIQNIGKAFSNSPAYTLIDRVCHLVAGLLLLIPLVNIIALLFFRLFNSLPEDDFINRFVENYLFPYYTGQITPENEPQPHIPMMENLAAAFSQAGFNWSQSQLQEEALKQYVYRSCLGLYVHLQRIEQIELDTPEFQSLLNALNPAIRRDFPNFTGSIEELARNGLTHVNRTRLAV